MENKKLKILLITGTKILFIIARMSTSTLASATPSVAFYFGIPFNFSSTISIYQKNQPTITETTTFVSEPFVLPFYYQFNLSYEQYSFGMLHHKLYYKGHHPEISYYSISHGYNIFTFARKIGYNSFYFTLGIGFVMGHPENSIRHKGVADGGLLNAGYTLTGPELQLGIGKDFLMTPNLDFDTKFLISYSYASVPIYEGNSNFHLWSLHTLLGPKWNF